MATPFAAFPSIAATPRRSIGPTLICAFNHRARRGPRSPPPLRMGTRRTFARGRCSTTSPTAAVTGPLCCSCRTVGSRCSRVSRALPGVPSCSRVCGAKRMRFCPRSRRRSTPPVGCSSAATPNTAWHFIFSARAFAINRSSSANGSTNRCGSRPWCGRAGSLRRASVSCSTSGRAMRRKTSGSLWRRSAHSGKHTRALRLNSFWRDQAPNRTPTRSGACSTSGRSESPNARRCSSSRWS